MALPSDRQQAYKLRIENRRFEAENKKLKAEIERLHTGALKMARIIAADRNNWSEVGVSFDKTPEDILAEFDMER